MKKIVIFLMASFLFTTTGSAAAAEHDLCICQTGTEPQIEVGIYKLGCKFWNSIQSCSKKMTVSFSDSLDNILSENSWARSIRLGYVGHWSSSYETVNFLSREIVPAIRKHDISFSIDNTACSSTDDPYQILGYLKIIPEADRISFSGNQAISTGMWDRLLIGKNNFWAKISGKKLKVTYPSCKEFENKNCFGMFQLHSTGVCKDEESGNHVFLRCEEVFKSVIRPTYSRREAREEKEKAVRWKRLKLSLEIRYGHGAYAVRERNNAVYVYQPFSTEEKAQAFIDQIMLDASYLSRYYVDKFY